MDSPVETPRTRIVKFPMPQELPQAVALMNSILTSGYGIAPEDGLSFMYVLR